MVVSTLLRRGMLQCKSLLVQKRGFTQVGMVISTPARVRVSTGEQICHIGFMLCAWLSPIAYAMTQIKVWRREYIS